MAVGYVMVLYSNFNLNLDLQFQMGYVHIGLILLLLAVNIGVMINNQARRLITKRKTKELKRLTLKRVKEVSEKAEEK